MHDSTVPKNDSLVPRHSDPFRSTIRALRWMETPFRATHELFLSTNGPHPSMMDSLE